MGYSTKAWKMNILQFRNEENQLQFYLCPNMLVSHSAKLIQFLISAVFFLGLPLLLPFITRKVYTSVSNWKSVTLDMKTFKLIFITWRREQNFLKGSIDSSLIPMHETQERYIDSFLLAWVAIVSVGLESKERPRNGIFGTCFAYAKYRANPTETLATQASVLWAKR